MSYTERDLPGMTSSTYSKGKYGNIRKRNMVVGEEALSELIKTLNMEHETGGNNVSISLNGVDAGGKKTYTVTYDENIGDTSDENSSSIPIAQTTNPAKSSFYLPDGTFDKQALASVLGGVGKAIMGPFQQSWQAQLGGLGQNLAQSQIQSRNQEAERRRRQEYNKKFLDAMGKSSYIKFPFSTNYSDYK